MLCYDSWIENFVIYMDMRVGNFKQERVLNIFEMAILQSDLISSKYLSLPNEGWFIEVNDIINGIPYSYSNLVEATNE